jgi:hypothetical protein
MIIVAGQILVEPEQREAYLQSGQGRSTLAGQVRGWRRATTRQATALERIGRPSRWWKV